MRILMVSNLWPPEVVGGAEQYAAALGRTIADGGSPGRRRDARRRRPRRRPDRSRRGRTRSRRRLRSPRPSGCCSTRSTSTTRAPGGPWTRCSTSCVRTSCTRTRCRACRAWRSPSPAGTASRTCTRSTTTGCCASATRWCTATVARARRGAVRASASRGFATRRSAATHPGSCSRSRRRSRTSTSSSTGSRRGCGCSTTRWRSSRGAARRREVSARASRSASSVGSASTRESGPCSRRSSAPRCRTRDSWSRVGVRSRPRCGPRVHPSSPRGSSTQDRKEALLDDIDCLVVPSQWKDPAPVVLNEARGRGIPVIGATIGGIQELVAPECRPLAFPPGDVGALADRMTAYAAAPGAVPARARGGADRLVRPPRRRARRVRSRGVGRRPNPT